MTRPICQVPECGKPINAKGLCHPHYRKWRLYGDPLHISERYRPKVCAIPDCGRQLEGNGLCQRHNRRLRLYGDPLICKNAPKGEGHVNKDGYRVVFRPGHPNASKTSGTILEHRWVMAEFLGRPLRPEETVHHKHGVRLDNSIGNLELWSSHHPRGQRVSDLVEWAREVLDLYGEEVDKLEHLPII